MRIFLTFLLGICVLQNLCAKRPSQTKGQQFTVEVDEIIHVSCNGSSDGAIYLTVTGQAPFSYTWSNGQTGDKLLDVLAGIYSCTVTDAGNSPVVLQNLVINQPAVLNVSLSFIQHITCLQPYGNLTASVAGGTSPYQYQWTNGDTGPTASPLNAGSYTLVVTDAEGCTKNLSATITQNLTAPTANAGAPVTVLCSNSTIQLQGSGSTGPQFNYLWTAENGGVINTGANTLEPLVSHTGTYILTITNNINGCTASDATTVSSIYQAPDVTVAGGTLSCAVNAVTLSASFNTQNATFSWQGPNNFHSTKKEPTVQFAGNYLLTVTDTITGCYTIETATVVLDTIHPTATASVSGTISCSNPTVFLLGWSNVGNATYQWTGPNGFNATGMQAQTGTPGLYTLIATDPQNGCSAIRTITVAGSTTPPTVSATVSGPITCVISQVTLTGIVQPAGMQIVWSGPNGFLSNNPIVSVNMPGDYTLQATNTQNGCKATVTVTVTQNKIQPDLTASGGIMTCANPTVTLHANSNTPGLSFKWTGPNGYTSTQQHPVVNVSGFYTVVATNPVNGCTRSASVSVTTNYTPPVISTTNSSVSCANPIGKPTATAYTPGTSFVWTGPGGFYATGGNPSVTVPGFYTVTATNPANGCTVAVTVEVYDYTQPPIATAGEPQTLNCTQTPILLSGFGSSSFGSFSYLWTTFDGNILSGATSLYPRINAVGTYTLKVTNNQTGCTAVDSVEVTQAPPVTATVSQIVHVSCNGTATGSATVTAGGGNGTYSYGWSDGQNTSKATGLSAGLYTVTVSDSDGCSTTTTVQINQPSPLVANTSATPQTMFGVNNGTATVTYSGGTAPYSVKWNTGPVTAVITNLAPGTYTVTVTDSKGCTIVKTAQVNAMNCNLSGTIAATAVTCFGAANGSATANPSGGQNPILYLWSTGAQTKTISNLAPANYTVTVSDAAGCSLVLNTQITSPSALSLNFVAQENVQCPTSKDGSLTIGVTGGTTPYGYAWSNNQTTATASGLAPGNYTVTVTDAKGCTQVRSSQIIITDKTPPQLILKNATASLNTTGTAFVTPAMFDNGSFDAECSIASWAINPTSFNCSQIGQQTVTLTATDVNGNSKTGTATVTITDNIAPSLICPSNILAGACTATVQFNAPTVTDNCSANPNPIQQTAGLPSGSTFPAGKTIQIFSCTDASGNTAICSFEVTISELPDGSVTPIPASCSGLCDGSAVFIPTGQAPGLVKWSNGQSGPIATNLCTGNYGVTLTDAYGCTRAIPFAIESSNNGTFEIFSSTNPASCSNSCDGNSNLTIAAGTGPFLINWSNGQIGETAVNLCAGAYSATVTDAYGCSQVQPVQVLAEDNSAPTLICPSNITTSFCAPTVQYNQPVVQDNCTVDLQRLELLSGLPSGSAFPQGVTTQFYYYEDAAGNNTQCSFTVTVREDAELTLMANDASCAGACNGAAFVSTTGGYGPFSIKWSNGQQGALVSNLCPGNYAVTVTDAAGCTQARQLAIGQPAALNLNILQVKDDTGNAGVGQINVEISGGTAPYNFAWTRNGLPFSAQQNLQQLQAGVYQLVVTDAQGCTISTAAITLSNTVASHEAEWATGLSLQPNPASAFTQIQFAAPLGQEAQIRLISASGILIKQENLPATANRLQLELDELPAGLYIVHIRTEDGQEAIRKLLIQ